MSMQSTGSARVFRLPDLGEGLTEATLVQWLVSIGDTIATDQPIAEVETAKSVVELPSPFAGIVIALHGAAGDTIDVGAPVLEVGVADGLEVADGVGVPDGLEGRNSGEPHESRPIRTESAAVPVSGRHSGPGQQGDGPGWQGDGPGWQGDGRAQQGDGPGWQEDGPGQQGDGPGWQEDGPAQQDSRAAHEAYRREERAGSGNVLIGYGTSEPAAARRRRRPAIEHTSARDPDAATHTATPARNPDAAARRRTVAVRSPLVRRLARDLGLDVRAITATGADGAVTRADVLRAAVDSAVDGATSHERGSAAAEGIADGLIDGLGVRTRERLSPLRRAVSAKLTRSRAEIPEATVWVDVDATALWELRAEVARDGGAAPSLTALAARFALIALEDHPVLASRLSETGDELLSFDGVNLGVAADTERGLLVPVIRRAHALTVDELDTALRELAATARAGSLPPERLRGSTFTLNNYGGLGVDGSAAIINHPDVAILGIGRMIERPWVVDGAIVARRIVQLSLVFDHRVCDGGYAASFLRQVAGLIEHPLRAFGRVR